ncbi:MAG: hypothetical protein JXA90_03835 [Planctomycetes bacterium]|nr:hypothetical protein [Planctomycetota bacterium]
MKGWRLVLAAGALLAIGVASGVLLFPGRSIQHPPGVLVAEDPVQWDLSESTSFVVDNYQIAALASYEIKARVLSKKRYWTGREADLSPCDLALGWGPMSDQSVVDRMSIRQSRRWYRYRYDSPPIPQRSIETHSANTHIIPASDAVASRLGDVVKGHIVEMTGYLVLVTGGDGWRWKSSLSRDDRGGHSCEVFYVEDLVIHE